MEEAAASAKCEPLSVATGPAGASSANDLINLDDSPTAAHAAGVGPAPRDVIADENDLSSSTVAASSQPASPPARGQGAAQPAPAADVPAPAPAPLPTSPQQPQEAEPGHAGAPSGASSPARSSQRSKQSEEPDEQSEEPDEQSEEPDDIIEDDEFGDFVDFASPGAFNPPSPTPGARSSAAGSVASVSSASPSVVGMRVQLQAPPSHHHHAAPTHANLRFAHGSHGHAGHPRPPSVATSAAPTDLMDDYSDFTASPPPSAPASRAGGGGGGGRKSIASIASMGSRAGGEDEFQDYGSMAASSVWQAPSQMATSSYAAAAGADDDFGDLTSEFTSASDFTAPSTQPPSAVAVSGPGSVHPDDDFGSFASHRSTADDDEDDFGQFNAAPQGAGGAGGSSTAAAAAGAGPSGHAGHGQSSAGGSAGAASSSGSAAQGGPGHHHHHHSSSGGGAGPSSSSAAAVAASPLSHQPAAAGAGIAAAGQPELGLMQLPSHEFKQAVAQALQPLLPADVWSFGLQPGGSALQAPSAEAVAAAWAQLQQHASRKTPAAVPGAGADGRQQGRGARVPSALQWKGSSSERRLLASLGLTELAAKAAAAEAEEAAHDWRRSGRQRGGSGSSSGRVGGLGLGSSGGWRPGSAGLLSGGQAPAAQEANAPPLGVPSVELESGGAQPLQGPPSVAAAPPASAVQAEGEA